jgi:hypothetical protein
VHAEASQSGVEARGKDPVAVVNQESVLMIKGEKLAELLSGPVGGRVSSDVGVQNPAISIARNTLGMLKRIRRSHRRP